MAKKTRSVKCSEEHVKLLEFIMEKFKEKYGVEISYTKATEILTNKIKLAGGINI